MLKNSLSLLQMQWVVFAGPVVKVIVEQSISQVFVLLFQMYFVLHRQEVALFVPVEKATFTQFR